LVELESPPEAPALPDQIGRDWSQVPFGEVKSARNNGPSIITARIECVECKRPMWTCDPQREDLCEEDDYFLRSRNWDLRAQRNQTAARKPFNPFSDNPDLPRIFWPLDK
jgi:hypothetical protein